MRSLPCMRRQTQCKQLSRAAHNQLQKHCGGRFCNTREPALSKKQMMQAVTVITVAGSKAMHLTAPPVHMVPQTLTSMAETAPQRQEMGGADAQALRGGVRSQ